MAEAKLFKEPDDYGIFSIEVDKETYDGVIPEGMEDFPDEAIRSYAIGVIESIKNHALVINKSKIRDIKQTAYEKDDIVIEV